MLYSSDDDDRSSQQELEELGYTLPEYYFVFTVKDNEGQEIESHSSLVLEVGNWYNFTLKDDEGNVLKDFPYSLYLADNRILQGQSDATGRINIAHCPIGQNQLQIGK